MRITESEIREMIKELLMKEQGAPGSATDSVDWDDTNTESEYRYRYNPGTGEVWLLKSPRRAYANGYLVDPKTSSRNKKAYDAIVADYKKWKGLNEPETVPEPPEPIEPTEEYADVALSEQDIFKRVIAILALDVYGRIKRTLEAARDGELGEKAAQTMKKSFGDDAYINFGNVDIKKAGIVLRQPGGARISAFRSVINISPAMPRDANNTALASAFDAFYGGVADAIAGGREATLKGFADKFADGIIFVTSHQRSRGGTARKQRLAREEQAADKENRERLLDYLKADLATAEAGISGLNDILNPDFRVKISSVGVTDANPSMNVNPKAQKRVGEIVRDIFNKIK